MSESGRQTDIQVTAVLVAAGHSRRMGFDKLGICLGGKPVLQKSFEAFAAHPLVEELVLVTGEDRRLAEQLAQGCPKPVTLVQGGDTRAASALKGVQAARGRWVAIHDAARPFVSTQVIEETLLAAQRWGAAAPAVPVKDTVKVAPGGVVQTTPDRASLFAVQTPQCFERARYLQAAAQAGEAPVTDDCQLLERVGASVHLTRGEYANYKITTVEDIREEKQMRIGHGYDVHRLTEGRPLILGGVTIPYPKGLLGHSDADVLAHAVMDALLGAAALGDIGQHFPDSDPLYRGADSLLLMEKVRELLRQQGWQVENIDATILCQAPKLAPYIGPMRRNLAQRLGLTEGQISVKATTEEGLGFTGQGQGIAAHAVALISR